VVAAGVAQHCGQVCLKAGKNDQAVLSTCHHEKGRKGVR
jgi:hypothetical protein